MKYEKLILIPYEEKDKNYLKNLLTSNSQNFLVATSLLNILRGKGNILNDAHKIWYFEYASEAEKQIGTIILQEISSKHKSGELLFIFDNEEIFYDFKIFRAILSDLIDYIFMELDLLRLQVEVLENNLKLRKAYKSVGFVEEGLLRNKYEIKNRRYDAYVMSILKIEWARMQKVVN